MRRDELEKHTLDYNHHHRRARRSGGVRARRVHVATQTPLTRSYTHIAMNDR